MRPVRFAGRNLVLAGIALAPPAPNEVCMKRLSLVACSVLLFSACGKSQSPQPQSASAAAHAQAAPIVDSDGNAVVETSETIGPDAEAEDTVAAAPSAEDEALTKAQAGVEEDFLEDVGSKAGYLLPDFQPSWGLSRSVYDKAVTYMDLHEREFSNQRYVVLIDMGKHSGVKRFFLFDLDTGKLERHNVAHGSGSDPKHSGYAKRFSNKPESNQSSLGAYRTSATYSGHNGYSLRLDGLEGTNNNARRRLIVVHGAKYVNERESYAGRSSGCPALDKKVSKSVIDRIRGGALLLIWK